jgi:hypothetical protein
MQRWQYTDGRRQMSINFDAMGGPFTAQQPEA